MREREWVRERGERERRKGEREGMREGEREGGREGGERGREGDSEGGERGERKIGGEREGGRERGKGGRGRDRPRQSCAKELSVLHKCLPLYITFSTVHIYHPSVIVLTILSSHRVS